MLLALTTLVVLAGPSVGEDLDLTWSAPPACPQHAEVRAEIDLNLARDDFGESLDEVRVHGSIEPQADEWRLEVDVQLPTGHMQRTVRSSDCAELAEAAGLIIAVALDPLRVVQTLRPEPTEPVEPTGSVESSPAAESPEPADPPGPPEPRPRVPAPESDPEPAPEPTPEPEPEPEPTRQRSVELRLGGLGELGSLDVARVGVWAGAGLRGSWIRIDLAAHYHAPRTLSPFAESPDAGVRLQHIGMTLRGCATPPTQPVTVGACVGLDGGLALGRGINLPIANRSTAPWLALTLGPELSWSSTRRIGVFVLADALINLVRPRWNIQPLGAAAETRRVGFRVVVGPAVRL